MAECPGKVTLEGASSLWLKDFPASKTQCSVSQTSTRIQSLKMPLTIMAPVKQDHEPVNGFFLKEREEPRWLRRSHSWSSNQVEKISSRFQWELWGKNLACSWQFLLFKSCRLMNFWCGECVCERFCQNIKHSFSFKTVCQWSHTALFKVRLSWCFKLLLA